MDTRESQTNGYSKILPTKVQNTTIVISRKCSTILHITDNAHSNERPTRNSYTMANYGKNRCIKIGLADFTFHKLERRLEGSNTAYFSPFLKYIL